MILIALWTALAFADDVNPETCAETAQTQLDMQFCVDARYKVADARLNEVYKRLTPLTHDAEEKSKLVKAQRAWIAFRDTECAWEGDKYRGGSLEPYEAVSCLLRLTEQRTQELEGEIGARSH
jgi:uncharacterized protein YecT (DUF1311 family)